MNRSNAGIAVSIAFLMLWADPAAAQPGIVRSATVGPWGQGISRQEQLKARQLFLEANQLFDASVVAEATKKYREALTHWDHPAFHFNLAVAVMMSLDQPSEIYRQLEAALRYGPEPLSQPKYDYAITQKDQLDKQMAWVDISCDVPGARVTMDDHLLFVAPGHFEGLVHPGMHSITAEKQGYRTNDKSRTLHEGERVTLALKMYPSDCCIDYVRPLPEWLPWIVVGAGVAVAGGGGLMHSQARDSYAGFDAGVIACGGCVPTPALAVTRTQGDSLQRAAYGGYIVGGAAMVAGLVLLGLNQPQPHPFDPEQREHAVSVTPFLGRDMTGAVATLHFP